MNASIEFYVPAGAEPALRGDSEAPAVFVGGFIRGIKPDGLLGETKSVSFNDVPATWDEVKKRFKELTGGRELVLNQRARNADP